MRMTTARGQMRLAGEEGGENRSAPKHRPDREVELAGRQRESQAKRQDHQYGLRADDSAKIA